MSKYQIHLREQAFEPPGVIFLFTRCYNLCITSVIAFLKLCL